MKLTKIGQGLLAVAASVSLGLGMTSCSPSDTIDYLFVTSNSTNGSSANGQISSYHVDSQSGALSVVAGSPVSSQGPNPVAEVASPNGQFLYVANHGNDSIAEFTIGTDGQLAFGKSYTPPGSEPVSLAINTTGTLLFVLNYYGPGFSDATPGPGALVVYPINADGSLGSPVSSGGAAYTALQCFPGGVAVSQNGDYVYVTNTNSVIVTTAPPTTANPPPTPAGCPTQGTVSGFTVSSSGALTAVPGSPFPAGTTPTGIAIDLTNRFLYATDSVQNQIIAWDILGNGALQPLPNGPFATSIFPVNLVVDPRDEYIYVTDYNAKTISAFTISQSTGQPSALASNTFDTGDPGPTCILVEPSLGRYVYASLSLFNAVAAAQLGSQHRSTHRRAELSVLRFRNCHLCCCRPARQPCDAACLVDCRPVTASSLWKARRAGPFHFGEFACSRHFSSLTPITSSHSIGNASATRPTMVLEGARRLASPGDKYSSHTSPAMAIGTPSRRGTNLERTMRKPISTQYAPWKTMPAFNPRGCQRHASRTSPTRLNATASSARLLFTT